MQAFEDKEAWSPVDTLPSDKTLVECKWVFKKKANSDKSVRYRARLEAKGSFRLSCRQAFHSKVVAWIVSSIKF